MRYHGNQFVTGTHRLLLAAHLPGQALPLEGNQGVANALNGRRVDLVLGPVSVEFWRKQRLDNSFQIGGRLQGGETEIAIAVRKDWPILRGLLDKAILSLSEADYAAIRMRWMLPGPEMGPGERRVDLAPRERIWLEDHPLLRYCFTPDRAPFDFVEDGSNQGMFPDYLQLFARRLGAQFTPVATEDWAQAQERLQRRDCDLLVGSIQALAADALLFTRPFLDVPQVFLAKSDKPFVPRLDHLAGRRVGVLAGAPKAHGYPDRFPDLVWVEDRPAGLLARLERGDVHAVLLNLEMADRLVKERLPKYKIIGKMDGPHLVSVAVRGDWPELVAALDKAVASLSEADHNDIQRRWSRVTLAQPVDFTLLWQVAGGLLALLLLLLYWNRSLARSRAAVQRSEAFIRTTLDALSEHLCVLDGEGTVITVNRAWKAFAAANPPIPANYGVGANYLAICERAEGASADQAARFGEGLRAVLRGERAEFHLEYLCDAPDQARWFIARAVPFHEVSGPGRVLVTHEDITQRKQAELAREAARLRMEDTLAVRDTLLNNALVAIAFMKERRFVWVNDQMVAMLGYPREEILGRSVEPLYADPEDFARVGREAPPVLLRGDSYQGEFRYRRKDGSTFWCQISGRLVDPADPAKGAIYIVNDIDERRRAEEALRANEEKLRGLYELSPLGIALTDMQGRYLEFNDAFARITGYPAEELKTLDYWTLTPPEYAAQEQAQLASLQTTGRYGPYQKEYLRKDGTRVPLRLNGMRVAGRDGQPLIWSLVEDITDQVRTEAQVRKLSRAVEQSHSTIVITNLDAHIEFANPAFTRSTGYTLAEALDQNPRILQSGEHDAVFYQAMWDTLSRGEVWQGELHNKRKDGSLYWEFATISPVKDDAGRTTHYVAVKEDITAQRQQQAELRQAKEAAEAANRAKSAFLANMSHELRTPLNAMLGHAQILQRDAGLNDKQRRSVETILRSGDHLITLINDILDLAKIEAGRLDLASAPCDLHALFRGLEELFKMRAQDKGIGFRYLETTPLPTLVQADEKRLRQIAMNLLGNAVKFTEKGEVRLEAGYLKIPASSPPPPQGGAAETGREFLELAVIDTGIGIPPERIDSLFQPFQQEGSAEYRNQGTGLGLAIVRQLIEQMRGAIEVQSEPGQGSRFSLRLPLLALAESPMERNARPVGPPIGYRRSDGGAAPLRILVVDDQADNREVLRGLLTPLGFEILEAEDGAGALALAAEQRPDLVLMDLVMPGMNGLEATRRLLALPGLDPAPVVIACSASAYPEDRGKSANAGCRDHIAKPVRGEELFAALKRHLSLIWETAPAAEPAGPEGGVPVIDPRQREALLAIVRRGNIMQLRKALEALPRVPPELREALGRFDLKRVRALLEGGHWEKT